MDVSDTEHDLLASRIRTVERRLRRVTAVLFVVTMLFVSMLSIAAVQSQDVEMEKVLSNIRVRQIEIVSQDDSTVLATIGSDEHRGSLSLNFSNGRPSLAAFSQGWQGNLSTYTNDGKHLVSLFGAVNQEGKGRGGVVAVHSAEPRGGIGPQQIASTWGASPNGAGIMMFTPTADPLLQIGADADGNAFMQGWLKDGRSAQWP